jgi:hypothetical protein
MYVYFFEGKKKLLLALVSYPFSLARSLSLSLSASLSLSLSRLSESFFLFFGCCSLVMTVQQCLIHYTY